MSDFIPPQPPNSFRITLNLDRRMDRLDSVLLAALIEQAENTVLQGISRSKFKDLFAQGKVMIKGQRAKATSHLAAGITYVDILGF